MIDIDKQTRLNLSLIETLIEVDDQSNNIDIMIDQSVESYIESHPEYKGKEDEVRDDLCTILRWY